LAQRFERKTTTLWPKLGEQKFNGVYKKLLSLTYKNTIKQWKFRYFLCCLQCFCCGGNHRDADFHSGFDDGDDNDGDKCKKNTKKITINNCIHILRRRGETKMKQKAAS